MPSNGSFLVVIPFFCLHCGHAGVKAHIVFAASSEVARDISASLLADEQELWAHPTVTGAIGRDPNIAIWGEPQMFKLEGASEGPLAACE